MQEPVALTGEVEITTWANDVIRGRLVEETDSAYVVDTAPLDSGKPKLRRVPRAAVMTIAKRSREP